MTYEHKDVPANKGANHVPYDWTYANAAARTGASGFVSADIGKLALQTDDNTLWMLTATTPTWQQIGLVIASQAQAEAGTDNATAMTPLRVAQAIAALGSSGDKPPIGSIFLARDGDLCEGVLECAGAAVSRTTYKDLFLGSGVFPFDLTSATFLDEKGSITTFTVDTANTSGHFNTAKGSRVLAGCRMVISGVSYPIVSISGDGTGSNAVVFSGTLAAGTYAVQGIFGALAEGGVVGLSYFSTTSADYTSAMAQAGSTNNAITRIDKSFTLPNWKVITHIGTYLSAAGNTICYILRDNGANMTVMARAEGPISTTGFGYLQLEAPFVVPDSGTFYLAAFPNGSTLSYQSATAGGALAIGLTPGVGDTVTTQEGSQGRCCYRGLNRVYSAGQHYPLRLPALDCTDWTALKSLARTETLNSQNIWYALSFDGGTTYSAFVASAWLPIVRNNAGTWEYWTGSAWAAASINNALGAMAQAAGVTGNRMTGATMAGLSQAQIASSGGFVPGRATLPVLAALYSASATATPVLSELKVSTDPSVPSMPIGTAFGSGDGSTTFNLPNLTPPTGCMYVITYE